MRVSGGIFALTAGVVAATPALTSTVLAAPLKDQLKDVRANVEEDSHVRKLWGHAPIDWHFPHSPGWSWSADWSWGDDLWDDVADWGEDVADWAEDGWDDLADWGSDLWDDLGDWFECPVASAAGVDCPGDQIREKLQEAGATVAQAAALLLGVKKVQDGTRQDDDDGPVEDAIDSAGRDDDGDVLRPAEQREDEHEGANDDDDSAGS